MIRKPKTARKTHLPARKPRTKTGRRIARKAGTAKLHDPIWDMDLPPRRDLEEVYKEDDAAKAPVKP